MIRVPQVPVLIDAKLIDIALLQIQTSLVASLSWLNYSFGKAQRIKETKGKRTIVFPAVYVGKKEYLPSFPNEHLGNFSFFDVDDGIEVIRSSRLNAEFEANVGLIIWFDYRKVYPADWQQRTIENIKFDVLAALRSCVISGSNPVIRDTYERAENIYKGYTDTEIENQFLMRPYGGLRIDFTLRYNEINAC